jgi:type I restriction enzyme, S subunit
VTMITNNVNISINVGARHAVPLQNNLPEGWVNTTLENVVDILDSRRVPVNAEDRQKRRGTIPYYGATGQVGWIDDYLFNEELVLLGEDGAPFLEPTKQKAYIIRGKSWVNNHAHVLRARNGIPNAYIKYYLDIVDYHKFVSGTTRLKLNQSAMRQIPVPIAPPDQQQLIVAEIERQFSRLDEAVAALKRIQANLKRYKASVLKVAVEGKLTEQWRKEHPDVEPASELLKRILAERKKIWEEDYVKKYIAAHGHAPKDDLWKKKYKEPITPDTANLPELPKGWVWSTLESITIALGGYAFESKKFEDSGYQIVKMANIKMGKIDLSQHPSFIADLKTDVIKKYSLAPGDVLVTLTGTRKKRDYGYIAVVKYKANLLLNQRIARLRPFNGLLPKYLEIAMQSEAYKNRFFSYETGNVGQGNVGMSAITKEPILLPPLLEQQAIVDEIERRLSVVEEMEAAIEIDLKRAERLRQSILRKAFSGVLVKHGELTSEKEEFKAK